MRDLFSRLHNFFHITSDENQLVHEAPPVAVREIFRRFWPFARPYRFWILLALFVIALQPVMQAGTIWLFRAFIDKVLVPRDFGPMLWIIGAYLAFTVIRGALRFCGTYMTNWIGESFILNLRKSFFDHLQGLSLQFFENQKLGDLISRLSGDIQSIEKLVVTGVTSSLSYLFQLIVFTGFLFYLQWKLALVSLIIVPLFYVITRYFSRRIKQASRERKRRRGAISAVAEESFSNVAIVQAYNRQQTESDRFQHQNKRSFLAKLTKARLKAAFTPLIHFIQVCGMLIVMAAGAWLLVHHELSLGGLIAFLTLLRRLYSPVRSLSRLLNTVYSASASAERVIEFLDQAPAVRETAAAHEKYHAGGWLAFDHVSFAYPNKRQEILSNISFEAKPGEVVALVGASGAGKSTLIKLLLRFYEPTRGHISLDGCDIEEMSITTLRDNIAVLFQEPLIFDGTIKENIAYGKRGATEEEINTAAREADADTFIRTLPEGYETPVGQKGRNLSGGQRQRLAIARAMIRNAPILILDEPTEGLDALSGKHIMAPIQRLMSNKTTFIITHDFSSTASADQIIVLEQGAISERGTHQQLLEQGGLYAQLYHAQQVDMEEVK